MWAVTLLGGALTVGFSFLFGVPNFRLHLAMTGMLSASLALVIVLIVALDYPFRGQLSVSSNIYERLFERVVPAMTIDLANVRSVEPDYREMTDSMLTDTLYSKYFSDLPRESFDRMLVSEPP
jgi:ABC-type branched-subunit amino acid transport system permease subunit